MSAENKPGIFIISGGSGASGDQLVQTVLAQFPDFHMDTTIFSNVRNTEKIDEIVELAASSGSIILATLVDNPLNQYLSACVRKQGVLYIDLMGPLLERISAISGIEPAGHPGLYRKLHKAYFDRVAAIEYTFAHDDSKDPDGWKQAEVVLIGVSRVGKTPLSIYLSVLGWKVANIPLILDLEMNRAFFQLDFRRVIGLTIQPSQLLRHRQQRFKRMGAIGSSTYVDPDAIIEEITFFSDFMAKCGITAIDVTNKPIESLADEVIRIIDRRIGNQHLIVDTN